MGRRVQGQEEVVVRVVVGVGGVGVVGVVGGVVYE